MSTTHVFNTQHNFKTLLKRQSILKFSNDETL